MRKGGETDPIQSFRGILSRLFLSVSSPERHFDALCSWTLHEGSQESSPEVAVWIHLVRSIRAGIQKPAESKKNTSLSIFNLQVSPCPKPVNSPTVQKTGRTYLPSEMWRFIMFNAKWHFCDLNINNFAILVSEFVPADITVCAQVLHQQW